MSTLYFMGSLNGDREKFSGLADSIVEYLKEGPAAVFVSGNFGLGSKGFASSVSKLLKGRVPVHICGGHAGQEGWETCPPPEEGALEIAPNVFVHSFGSRVLFDGFSFLLMGGARSLPEDFQPSPRGTLYEHLPSDETLNRVFAEAEEQSPDIVISHLPPSSFGASLTASCGKLDPRRKRMLDPIIPCLDAVEASLLGKDYYWFSSGLNIAGQKREKEGKYISLMPIASARHFIASLEISPLEPGSEHLILTDCMY